MIGNSVNLLLLCVCFLLGLIFLLKNGRKLPKKETDLFFTLLIFLPYLCSVLERYEAGADWDFYQQLPTANISPFTFTLIFLAYFFPEKQKRPVYTVVSLLSVGMFFAGGANALSYLLRHYRYYLFISADGFCHIATSLFGIYLAISGQTDMTFRKNLASSCILYGTAGCMILLNLLFGTAFFGLAFDEKYNIYNMKIAPNAYLSALIYFSVLTLLLLLGFLVKKEIERRERHTERK